MGARKPQVLNRITNIWYYVSLKYTFILFGLTSGIFNLFFRPHGSRELYYTEDGEDSMAESVTTVESNHTGKYNLHTSGSPL